jgi:hypothetical protein
MPAFSCGTTDSDYSISDSLELDLKRYYTLPAGSLIYLAKKSSSL